MNWLQKSLSWFGIQNSITITTNTGDTSTSNNVGNSYKTYSEQVEALSQKSEYSADWGNEFVNNISVLRSFFTIGNGFKVQLEEGKTGAKAVRTLKFARQFMSYNDLDDVMTQNWAKESNIEGKALALLSVDKTISDSWLATRDESKNAQIRARHLSWTQHGYDVIPDEEDYTKLLAVGWTKSNGQKASFAADKFSYAKFGGRLSNVNISPPVMAGVLDAIENLDKALTDWRAANHLYASPTPHLSFESADLADKAWNELKDRQWKIGKLLVTAKATFQMVGIQEAGMQSLEQEIITWAKAISGATGIAVQFLGLPDLLSNRSTADNLLEQMVAAVNIERTVWKTFYEGLIKKAIVMANGNLQADLDQDAITVNIVEISSLQLHRLTQVMLPLSMGGVISKETVRDHVPDIDPDAEERKLEKQRKKEEADFLNSSEAPFQPPQPSMTPSNNAGRNV